MALHSESLMVETVTCCSVAAEVAGEGGGAGVREEMRRLEQQAKQAVGQGAVAALYVLLMCRPEQLRGRVTMAPAKGSARPLAHRSAPPIRQRWCRSPPQT